MAAESDYTQALLGHARHYAAVMEREGRQLHGSGRADKGAQQLRALRTLQVETENVNLAFESSLELNSAASLQQIGTYLYRFLTIKGDAAVLRERYGRLLGFAERQPGSLRDELELLARSGLTAALVRLGELDEARAMARTITDLAQGLGDDSYKAVALRNLGLVEHGQGNLAEACRLHQQSLEAARAAGDLYGESAALSNLGLAEYSLGNFDRANEVLRDALAGWRRRGDLHGEASTLQNLGNVAAVLGQAEAANLLFHDALGHSRRLGSRGGEAGALLALGYVARASGELSSARRHLGEAHSLIRELGDRQLEIAVLGNLAAVELDLDSLEESRAALCQALELAGELGNNLLVPYLCITAASVVAAAGNSAGAARVLASALAELQRLGHTLDAADQKMVAAARSRIGVAGCDVASANVEVLPGEQLLRFTLELLAS